MTVHHEVVVTLDGAEDDEAVAVARGIGVYAAADRVEVYRVSSARDSRTATRNHERVLIATVRP